MSVSDEGSGTQPREGCMVKSRLVRVGRVVASAATCDASSIIIAFLAESKHDPTEESGERKITRWRDVTVVGWWVWCAVM